jgi:hypothetical protein
LRRRVVMWRGNLLSVSCATRDVSSNTMQKVLLLKPPHTNRTYVAYSAESPPPPMAAGDKRTASAWG